MAIDPRPSDDDTNKNIDGNIPSTNPSDNSRGVPLSPKASPKKSKLDKLRTQRAAADSTFLERMMQTNSPEEEVEEVKESKGMFDGVFGDSKKKKKADDGDFIGGLFGRKDDDDEEDEDEEDVQPVEEKPGFFEGLFTSDKKEEKTSPADNTATQKSEQKDPETKSDSSASNGESDQKAEQSTSQPKSNNLTNNNNDEDDSNQSVDFGDNNRVENSRESRPQPINNRSINTPKSSNEEQSTDSNAGSVNSQDRDSSQTQPPSYKDKVNRYNPRQQDNSSSSQSRDRYTSPNQSKSGSTKTSISFRKKFNGNRNPQRSKKGIKMGLVAAAAIAAANLGSGGAQASSGIFNTPKSEVNQPTQVTNFEDQTSRPTENLAIDEFGIDTVGYNEDGSLSSSVNKGDGKKKQEKNQDLGNQSGQGSTPSGSKTKSSSPIDNNVTGPIPTLPNSAGGGQYDSGQLSVPLMEKTGFEGVGPGTKLSANQALKAPPIGQQPTKGMPTQSAAKQAPQLANMSGSGKKKIDAGKLAMAVIKPWLMQFAILFIILFALFSGLFGAVFKGVTQVIASFCSSSEFVRGLPGLKDTQAGKFANKACETLKALTGIGCGGLDSTSATGVGCVGKLLEAPGDKVNLIGPGGTTPVKKSCIQEIINGGKKAGVKEFTIRFAISIHPIESVGDCFKAVNPYGCLGLAQFCPGSYESAIRGINVTSTADFLANPDKQMKAIENFLAEKKSFLGGLPACVENFFKGKSEQFKLSYLWLTGGCPGTVDANGFRNDNYGEIADKNFAATDCNEFKTKLGSSDQTNYWQVINSFGKLTTEITAQAQMSGPDVADKAMQDEIVKLIESGKIRTVVLPGRSPSMFIADIRGTDGGALQGQKINGPPHKNTIAMLKLLADRFPGWGMSSLGNNTHHDSGGYHNKAPIQAIDFTEFANGVNTEDSDTATFNKLLDVLIDSKIVANVGLPPVDLARLDQKKLDKLGAFADGPGHIHISILASGTLGSSIGSGSTEECTFSEDKITTNQDRANINTRLNKKSLTDTEWTSLQKKFGKLYTSNQFVRIGDDAIFGSGDKLTLFDNKAASDRIYKLAVEAGYKERITAPSGDLVGAGEQRMRSTAKKALEALAKAAKTDGFKIILKSGFRSPLEQKGIYEDALQKLCNQKIGTDCTVADLAAGKHDGLIKEKLAINSVPGYSKHHTGLAADILETNESPLDQSFNKTELYKWVSEDNFFNLKRFGFIPSYPDGGENMGPFPEPWEILYVGPTAVQATQVETDAKQNNTPLKLGPVGPNGTFNPNIPTQPAAPIPGSTPSNIDGPTPSTTTPVAPTKTPSDIDGPTSTSPPSTAPQN
jgi:LAS superfamily LD-carboxypeptidase LdcB